MFQLVILVGQLFHIHLAVRDIKKKIALLFDWIAEAKAELAKPQAPDLVSLLNAYYTQRKAGAYSQKGKVSNLKEMNETFNYLRANGIYNLEDLESRVNEHSSTTESCLISFIRAVCPSSVFFKLSVAALCSLTRLSKSSRE